MSVCFVCVSVWFSITPTSWKGMQGMLRVRPSAGHTGHRAANVERHGVCTRGAHGQVTETDAQPVNSQRSKITPIHSKSREGNTPGAASEHRSGDLLKMQWPEKSARRRLSCEPRQEEGAGAGHMRQRGKRAPNTGNDLDDDRRPERGRQ